MVGIKAAIDLPVWLILDPKGQSKISPKLPKQFSLIQQLINWCPSSDSMDDIFVSLKLGLFTQMLSCPCVQNQKTKVDVCYTYPCMFVFTSVG